MRFPALLALLLAMLAAPLAAVAGPVNTGHIEAQLVAQDASVAPGSTVYVALRQKIQKGWHTYWRNSGDSGAATQIAWTLPAGWKAGDLVWAVPKRLIEGEGEFAVAVYAYEGEVLLPVAIQVPADARPGTTAHLKATVAFLVCAEQCVPENADLTLDIPVKAGAPAPDPQWGRAVTEALAKAPKPAGLDARFAADSQTLTISIAGAPLAGADLAGAQFLPYSPKALKHRADPVLDHGPQGLTLRYPAGYSFTKGTPLAEVDGVLVLPGASYEVTATPGAALPGTTGLGPPAAKARLGLLLAILYAFLGGLILNLMPCVFPVLSMKAASLAGHGGAARAEGLAFLAGVVATFLALAGALLALRAGGAAVGWGFQLQSPPVVAALSLIILLAALNLSGVFEIGTSIQGLGSGLAGRGGLIGAFFTGVLAVVVAAPCTAPFMGPALGLALTLSPIAALAIFLGLALGFAAPFTLLAVTPALRGRLPRPGPWMDVFRHVLAFPMYAAAAWLVWVLSQQTDSLGLARLLIAAVLVGFGAWLWGLTQARPLAAYWQWAAFLVLALAVLLITRDPYGPARVAQAPAAGKIELESQAWSPARVEALRAEGRPVLVNFTAAWCVTCQVNEGVALATPGVAAALKRDNAVYLVADWTNRDATIAAALSQFGRAGVPLYLVYGRDGGPPRVLPQLLTEGLVVKALDEAAATPPAAAAK
ncbi:thiol:disulfide interchange protein DsbD [Caulobacter ginsengisoli]|uniref:Thiol:disulfide interchange protein DsbD n=1 Tax=Caulobacter ginsengisoli TaxID=400775 RepID=A0ABU0IYX0_9CAUL|nr:thioredoxin family protein [Caulobacter ginsengisoli]MDQ0466516.1 thiol:disulfide interchange protein DsbD [Caulobacter ginsengisoli]